MGEVHAMPGRSESFDDMRAEGRTMRVTHHPERDVVVVSLWWGPVCRASFRLAPADLERLRDLLREAVDARPAATADAGAGDAGLGSAEVTGSQRTTPVPGRDATGDDPGAGPADTARLPAAPRDADGTGPVEAA
jgi:hypothetical protein